MRPEHNLYFGRLDLDDGEIRRIGRIGIPMTTTPTAPCCSIGALLSRPFYLATPAAPESVEMRRHIRTCNRTVRAVNDEYLTGDRAGADPSSHGDVVNESALVAALNAARNLAR